MAKQKRKRIYVDRLVQGAILMRLFSYGILCLLFATVPISIVRALMQPDRLLLHHFLDVCRLHWPILVTLTVLLPFVLYDALKLSHRFAGPIFRVQNDLDRFAKGEKVPTVRFRDNDFWQDLGTKVDQLIRRCEAAEARAGDREVLAENDVHELVTSHGRALGTASIVRIKDSGGIAVAFSEMAHPGRPIPPGTPASPPNRDKT